MKRPLNLLQWCPVCWRAARRAFMRWAIVQLNETRSLQALVCDGCAQ